MFEVQDYFKQEIRFKGYVIIKQATLKYKLSSYWKKTLKFCVTLLTLHFWSYLGVSKTPYLGSDVMARGPKFGDQYAAVRCLSERT